MGQGGIQMGNAVWTQYCAEHGIGYDGKMEKPAKDEYFKTFFEETVTGQLVSLSVYVKHFSSLPLPLRSQETWELILNQLFLTMFDEDQ